MNDEQIRNIVLDALRQVAPEADAATLDPTADFRDQLDIDSMDFLNFVIGLHEATGIDIPERDYPRLSSLDRCVEYLGASAPVA
jgi:acyl carrier protein